MLRLTRCIAAGVAFLEVCTWSAVLSSPLPAEAILLTLDLTAGAVPGEEAAPAATQDAPAAGGEQEVRAKLKALDEAQKAGILTEEEYAKKKAELEAKLRATAQELDPALQQKLKALDDARKAGVLSEDEYARKKAELMLSARGVQGAGAGPAGSAASAPLIPATKSKVFHHPIGFEFVHPVDWTVAEQGDMLVLTPRDQAKNAQGAEEAYFITGERVDTEGITSPEDPRIAEFLDEQVKQLLPMLQRTGKPGACDTSAGKAIVLDWTGRNFDGKDVVARCYVNIIKGYGVALAGIGFKGKVEARDTVLRRMFASFGMREGKVDAALAGLWSLRSTSALTNWSVYEDSWSRAKMATDSNTTLTLGGDGTWSRVHESQMLAGGSGIWIESNSRNVSKGKWYAGNGMLYLVTEDDLWETYKYGVEGASPNRRLKLASEKTGTLWQEAR